MTMTVTPVDATLGALLTDINVANITDEAWAETHAAFLEGNAGWHTDSTYMPLASTAAMLYALVVPPKGSETEFADMRAVWEALDKARQASSTCTDGRRFAG